jgi:alkane 1-monooxygenase
MYTHWLKYCLPFFMYVLAFFAFTGTGIFCWLPMLVAWVLIPLLELLIKPDTANLEAAEENMAKQNRSYDVVLYCVVLLQFPMLYLFLHGMQTNTLPVIDVTGRILSMGLLCGMFGINVGHELGHRVNRLEQGLAKVSLMSSLYMHFFIEHNKGHHKRVATPEDASSARYNEVVYSFYFRTIIFSYLSAWHIACDEVKKKGKPVWGVYNEMIQIHLLQAGLAGLIYIVFGWQGVWPFLLAAFIGILLLETVNYIEHYGLQRRLQDNGRYERAMPHHSWNSDHVLGRLLLFELSRHSDHHYMASRKYQVLRHHEASPQLPTGYPGSMILAMLPPLWFYIMNRKIQVLRGTPEKTKPAILTADLAS